MVNSRRRGLLACSTRKHSHLLLVGCCTFVCACLTGHWYSIIPFVAVQSTSASRRIQVASRGVEEDASSLAELPPEEFLDKLEEAGMFEGKEGLLLRLRELAADGVHPLEVLAANTPAEPPEEPPLDVVLSSFDIKGIAEHILERKCRDIVVMCGAGISTSAGIPDFRTPGTGLYDNLQRFNLSRPELIFDLDFFRQRPGAFYELCREMWPGRYEPTPAHYFIRLLSDRGILRRCYTQNIDSLERQAGIPEEKVVAAHGNFDAAHVIDTEPEELVDVEELRRAVSRGEAGWQELRKAKGNLVKPKIVFFGESLPERFYMLHQSDLKACDLLIVLGTSLVVQPFAGLVGRAAPEAPRLLINREPAGTYDRIYHGFRFLLNGTENWRDVWHEGSCDGGCQALAAALGWESELESLIASKGRERAQRADWA